jgi:NADH dehydrogenase FAD-containing subunit
LKRPRVLVVGGGFAGLSCANGLDSRRFEVTLIDRKRHFEFLPNIHELLSGVKRPAQLRLPLNACMQALGHRFHCAAVERIDLAARTVWLSRHQQLPADYLLIALGAEDATYGVAGVAENALGFKSVRQCQAIRQRLQELARGSGPKRVVLIGGGLEGVEALGEILRRYRHRGLSIQLVEAQSRLLGSHPPAVADFIAGHCREQGVALLLGDPVSRITAKTVYLGSGRRLRSELTIWTGGPAPQALLADGTIAAAGQWVSVTKNLAVPEHERVFVAGDASTPQASISKQAYHAMDMGSCVAENISRLARGRRPKVYRPSAKPTVLAFGDLSTVLIAGRRAVAGPALATAKEGIFVAVMTQLDQRPLGSRLPAVFDRGREATQQLLWPMLSSLKELQRQSNLQHLS